MEIFIEENDKLDAAAAANAFAHSDTRNRAYINTLGAELALKYLESENIDVSNIYNLHSIKKILEEIDISDIQLSNIHIDVRVIFDENAIFIPKSHFEYDLTPDIYIVLKPSQDFSSAECLGFFEPKLINKNNQNSDYYFIEKEKLNSALDLRQYIENFKGNTDEKLSDDEIEKCETIIVSMSDNDISKSDKKYLFQMLLKSADLRSKFIEYENFETLSYKAMTDSSITKREIIEETESDDIMALDTIEDLTNIAVDSIDPIDNIDPIESLDPIESVETVETAENIISELPDLSELPVESALTIDSPEDEIESMSFDNLELPKAEEEELENIETEVTDFENLDITDELNTEDTTIDETPVSFDNIEELELPAMDESLPQETMSLEDMELPQLETQEPELTDNLTSFDNIEELSLPQEELAEEPILEETPLEDLTDSISDELPLEETILESIPEPIQEEEELPAGIDEIIETEIIDEQVEENNILAEETNIEETFEEDTIPEIDDILDSVDEVSEPSSFGNDLLENLQEESQEIEETSQEDVSSDDLLSEIDDILNTTDEISVDSESLSNLDVSDITENNSSEEFNFDDLMGEENPENELGVLYTEESPQADLPVEEPVQENFAPKPSGKKNLVVAAALITVLAAAGAFVFMKNNKQDDIAEFTPTPAASENNTPDENLLTVNTPAVKTEVKKEVKEPVKELKNTLPAANPAPQAYMSVNRIVWDIPDSLSYSKGIPNYLTTAGKSIKLSLSTDLLLATEFAYTNQVKVGLKLSNSGSVLESKIISGSGSTEIDNIVLQSVKDTLNVLNPPANEIKDPDFKLNLIIYF